MDGNDSMVPEDSVLKSLMEWVWAPMAATIAWLWVHIIAKNSDFSKIVAEIDRTTDKRISLLEQHYLNIEAKLVEADNRRREDRQEIMERIDRHHETIYKKLDVLTERLPVN